ncbi:MAG TPA: uroporphyrinogen-III C-methyltransferase [Candidatus Deferrimicrobiaceae bacterium]|jgi:uroporphyrin-III C-methyltransferase/precorrin-2 dehydrogenase/sirohydrochlorin ferrochelatase
MAPINRYLPIVADVAGARILVVGAGAVAGRRALGLASRGACVTVVAPRIKDRVAQAAARGELVALREPFRPEHLEGIEIAFAATDDPAVNAAVAVAARNRSIPVNVADDPARCTFIMPAVVEENDFTIAVTTLGKNPGAARAIREFLEAHTPELSVRLERGRRRRSGRPVAGKVYIVGAGPGDPDLLTVRALGLLRAADVVIHDYLVPEEILSLAPQRAPKICYARRGATVGHGAAIKQSAIHEAMVRFARAGKAVIRLKSGDPLIFGRGGEEAEHLAAEGVPFEIVPGITAAAGCAAASNVALTHRTRASSVTFLAGHEACGKPGAGFDWRDFPRSGTLAIYMGVRRVEAIAQGLAEAGWPAGTPFTIVENGSRPNQRIVPGTLGRLAEIVRNEAVQSPAMLFVGESAVPVGGCASGTLDRISEPPLSALEGKE